MIWKTPLVLKKNCNHIYSHCLPFVEDDKFLLFVKNNEIRGVDIEQAHYSVIPVITVPHVDKPTAIDYDITTNTLYWADKGLNVINRANITDGSFVETLIDSGNYMYIILFIVRK